MSRRATSDTKSKKVSDIKNIPARRLYRGVLEYTRRLENGRQHRRNLMSIFHAEQTGLRHKLRDACEKLMFTHSLEYGKKAEEIIWRKVYYEVIQLVKTNKKIVKPGSRLELLYREYLSAAVGYYHHLLLKLQSKCRPTVDVDWPYASSLLSEVSSRKKPILSEKSLETAEKNDTENAPEEEDGDESTLTINQWAIDACYRILLCLGDLGRYLVELGGSRSFSERFYQLALLVKPSVGLPFNQLGTLAGHHTWWGLTAAYYYYRCLEAKSKYDGADANLQSLLDRNKKNFYQIPTDALENVISAEEYKKEHSRIFIISFLYLCDLLRPKTYATDVEITGLCKKLIDAFPVCLSHSSLPKDDNSEKSYASVYGSRNARSSKWSYAGVSHHHHHRHYQSAGDFTHIQPHVVLKMCALCIINIHSLQLSRSNRSSAAIAFALAFFSHLLGHVISLVDPDKQNKDDDKNDSGKSAIDGVNGAEGEDANENGDGDASHAQSKSRMGKKKRQTLLMRRRRHRGSGDSDLSEGELYSGSDLSGSATDSDDSDSSSTDSANLELSQEAMDETILENSKSSSSKPEKVDNEKKSLEEPKQSGKSETAVDNRAGLELANSLANGPSTLASLKDISQRMFQPTARRRILLAPSFFNNVPKQTAPPAPVDQNNPENKENDSSRALEITANGPAVGKEKKGDDSVANPDDIELNDGKEIKTEQQQEETGTHATDTDVHLENGGCDEDNNADEPLRKFLQVGVYHQLFASLKLLCDWLDANEKVTAACAQNSKALWSRMAKLASLLPNEEELEMIAAPSSDEMVREQLGIAKSCVSSPSEWRQIGKLPEDHILCEVTSSARYKNESDGALHSLVCDLSETQQSVIRVCRIRCFCHSLVGVEGIGMNYDEVASKFEGPEEPQEEEIEHLDIEAMERMRKARLMKDMAELRLRNEVDALESQLGTPRTRDASLCLYLVPDALALCHDLTHIKRLLSTCKFFVVIPKTVIDGLDGLKKDLQGARDAIRFLETEFKKGNRYVKAQMAEESSRGVHGERPKLRRNDMQAWRFYRIIECCRYIVEKKAKEESSQQGDTSGLVAILTHSTDKSTLSQNQINAIAAAESFGIQVFNAVQFCKLWKKPPTEGK